ncbi:hypothetical protein IW261DRAFT_1455651 [Armillaria novae-zelandiae]|uniref:DUF6534 domain-containing protein n=1 Tax=Armillaria novae-zelandiae TaxID=153914 RepID=A0AA39PMB7_9AGAR|nr:hypothetical protein IW261DRAFT_1455651 [Armillaria novae-zelandiae]
MLATYDAFMTFGYGFGDFEALTRMNFNWLVVPIMSGIVAFARQVFYVYRIFILSKSRTVPILITCISLTSFVADILTGVFCFEVEDVTKLDNRKMSITVGIGCGTSALCDIFIALCMTYYLMRSNTNFRQTRILVTKIIRLTIEMGTVTALVISVTSILFLVFPHYVLVVLNLRFQIMGGRDIYTSSTDMTITSTMMRDMTGSQSTEGTPVDGIQGRVSMVAIPKEVFNDDHEMGRMPVSHS